MAARPKVIFTQHIFGTGGIDRVSVFLANGFARHGYDVELLVFCEGGPAEQILRPLLSPAVCLTYLGKLGQHRTLDLIRLFPRFVGRLIHAKPAAIIATANNMTWICALGRWRAGLKNCRLAMKITNPVVRQQDKGLFKLLRWLGYDRAFAAADAVWPLSDAETQALIGHFPRAADHIRTVANPYVTPAMFAAGQTLPPAAPVKQVIAIGRLAPQKRLDLLLQAFALIDPSGAHLTIVGDGEDRMKLEALIKSLGIADRVTMAGFIADVTPFLARADLLALPSVYEGLPAVILEAMAANCPVISTDCFPCARELLADAPGCGIIEHPEPAALAQMIRAHLRQERPTTLSDRATPYSIEAGIQSHVDALTAIGVAPQAHG
jgi:glycosyltransferase involved in cell wall biosynthesis